MHTVTEAAKMLGLSPKTLHQQIANGKLAAQKMGPIWTVTLDEIERYRREHLRTREMSA